MANQQRDPEEAFIGKDLGSREFVAHNQMMDNYYAGLEVDRSFYDGSGSPLGGAHTPSMTLTEVDGGFAGAGFKQNFGNLWMRQQWEVNAPIVPETRYSARSQVLDIYEHRNRTVVLQQVELLADDGSVMAGGRHHQSYRFGQSSGFVALRDPKAKGGARRFEMPEGDLIESDPHTISLEMCGTFFHGNRNYHTSKEAAEELGFQEVVVGGKMSLSYVGALMDRHFGANWYTGSKLDIKFTNIVWPDDTIVAKAVVTDEVTEGGKKMANVAVWMEKEDGTVTVVGTASTPV